MRPTTVFSVCRLKNSHTLSLLSLRYIYTYTHISIYTSLSSSLYCCEDEEEAEKNQMKERRKGKEKKEAIAKLQALSLKSLSLYIFVIPAISKLYCSPFMNDIIMCNIGVVINLMCVILVFTILDLFGVLSTKRLLLIQAIGVQSIAPYLSDWL